MMANLVRRSARLSLMATTALVAFPLTAMAQDANPSMLDKAINEATAGADKIAINQAQYGLGSAAAPVNDPSIVIAQPGTPTTARDTGVTGIGQMIIDQKNGFVGLCTGTLINPRTVIFAAHCVNESPTGTAMNPWGYGTGTGQLPIGFGFQANTVAGQIAWFNSNYKTSVENAFYNVSQVVYNPDSLKLGLANNFLQGDVALATLDTPAADVPTWAILFSALPAPSAINDKTGTGYHVTEVGYGVNGTGDTGAIGQIDYRRRAAENYIGLLGSLDDRDLFLFGQGDGLPQNLYQLDFDDPRRGTAGASPYDFNLFKDDALPKEGITAGGDSGGPLILDREFAKQVVIGVLSGGSRFFNGQASGSYGTSSFYQPLYLFWDYIAANNPYRYASAKAGDGAWTDASHWATTLDPAYQVILNGQLVNGMPTAPGAGIAGDGNKFGQVCDQEPALNQDVCYDVKTGVYYVDGEPFDPDAAQSANANSAATKPKGDATVGGKTGGVEFSEDRGQADGSKIAINEAQDGDTQSTQDVAAAALPNPTLANGLPGATNFVPNNVDPDAATRRNGRYFDITLSAAGTTTLDNASITIDRLTMTGSAAKLSIGSTGSLTSLMSINQYDGMMLVNGTLSTRGDYFLMSGGLAGSGRINTPFFTNATGMIAPGGIGTIGTLTFGGNAILASGSKLLIDVGPNATSDKIAVVKVNGADGIANIGGAVGFAPVSGYTIQYGDIYTIVTAEGGVTGTFSDAKSLSAILKPQFIYNPNSVQARIIAGRYADVVAATPVQRAYAQLLDQNRATNYNGLSSLYGVLDLQNAETIQGTLESLAPRAETLKRSLGTVALDNMSRFYRERLGQIDVSRGLGGSLTMIGKPFQVASVMANAVPGMQVTASDTAPMSVREGVLPDTVSAFVAGGYIDGDSRPMPGVTPPGGRDQFDGYYVAAGLEAQPANNSVLGFGLSYSRTSGDTTTGQRARGELIQGTLYGKLQSPQGLFLDTQTSAGVFRARTFRMVNVVGNQADLRSRDDAFAFTSEIGAGAGFSLGAFQAGPRAAVRVSHLGFTPTRETGGIAALQTDRQDYDSVQARGGLFLSGGDRFRPYASAYFVHDFKDRPGVFGANFVGGVGPSALFALAGQDKNWGELAAGVTFGGEKVEFSAGADTTVGRGDVSNQAYRGSVTFHF